MLALVRTGMAVCGLLRSALPAGPDRTEPYRRLGLSEPVESLACSPESLPRQTATSRLVLDAA